MPLSRGGRGACRLVALPRAFPDPQFVEVDGVEGVAQTPSACRGATEDDDPGLASDARD